MVVQGIVVVGSGGNWGGGHPTQCGSSSYRLHNLILEM